MGRAWITLAAGLLATGCGVPEANQRDGSDDSVTPTLAVPRPAPLSNDEADAMLANDIAPFVAGSQPAKRAAVRAQYIGSASLLDYEKKLERLASLRAASEGAAACGYRTRTWLAHVESLAADAFGSDDVATRSAAALTPAERSAAAAVYRRQYEWLGGGKTPAPQDCVWMRNWPFLASIDRFENGTAGYPGS